MSQRLVTGLFDATLAGFVPASGGGSTTFLRADGVFAATGGSSAVLADGDYGDVTVSGSGTVLSVDALPESRITNLTADLAAKVPNGRTLTATAPLTIGGGGSADLSADRTLAIVAFTTAVAGAVTASSAAANVLRGDNTWSTITQLTAALNLFTSSLQGLVPASGGGTTTFLRADGAWAAPTVSSLPLYDTTIDVTASPVSFGATYDNWNVGTLGQNTLVQYITDGIPSGTNSRNVRGFVGGSVGKLVTFMNMSPGNGGISFQHLDGTASAGNKFNNCASGAVTGNAKGCVTYWHDGTLWRHLWSTAT